MIYIGAQFSSSMEICLREGSVDPYFKHSTNGEAVNFKTEVSLSRDAAFLHIEFSCFENPYTLQNTLKEHNAPLYQQEVFEVFIAAGSATPTRYWEIEINPNGAVWIGEIENLAPGVEPQRILGNRLPEEFGLGFQVNKGADTWSGKLSLPFSSIGEAAEYRLNFYRIRSKVPHTAPDWACDEATCDFLCWQSTLSGAEPAFHRPAHFGLLRL